MDRTERLLDLVALLLDSREPVSWAELKEAFREDYGKGRDDAAERKFERDKAELLELGIPIRYVQGDDERKDGYVVDRDAYYLPRLDLSPEELAVLYAAGSAALASGAFPGHQDLAHALRKIGFFGAEAAPAPPVRLELEEARTGVETGPLLEQLWQAAASRKWVELVYQSPHRNEPTRRKVDPYGLALRRGNWSMVGHCHLRKGIRTFFVHRIRDLKVNPAKPRSPDFDVPADFRLDDYVASYPWQHRFHPSIPVSLKLTGALASRGDRLFPGARSKPNQEGTELTVEATYLEGLLRYALSLSPWCKVLGPKEALDRWNQLARQIASEHQGEALA